MNTSIASNSKSIATLFNSWLKTRRSGGDSFNVGWIGRWLSRPPAQWRVLASWAVARQLRQGEAQLIGQSVFGPSRNLPAMRREAVLVGCQ